YLHVTYQAAGYALYPVIISYMRQGRNRGTRVENNVHAPGGAGPDGPAGRNDVRKGKLVEAPDAQGMAVPGDNGRVHRQYQLLKCVAGIDIAQQNGLSD